MARFEQTLKNLKEIAALMPATVKASPAAAGRPGSAVSLSAAAIVAALAEALKSDNSKTQAIAVRIANLAAKYPNKAY